MRLRSLSFLLAFVLPAQIQRSPAPLDGLDGVVALASSAALRDDGTVWTWTESYSPGGRTITGRSAPRQVDGLIGVAAITDGAALKADGTVWEFYGPEPVEVTGLSEVVAIDHYGPNLALKGDGTVWAWGFSGIHPVFQLRHVGGAVAIAALGFGGLALRADGTVWLFSVVDSEDPDFFFPVDAVWQQIKGLNGIVAIDGSYDAALALKNDGTVWNVDVPVSVQVQGLAGVRKVAIGGRHCLALMEDGTVWEWGRDYLGPGYTVKTTWQEPRQVVGLTGVVEIAANYSHSFALLSDGTVLAWGHEQLW